MKAAFGTKYGLSSILAPNYWYLRGMDPKGMEPYVDFLASWLTTCTVSEMPT